MMRSLSLIAGAALLVWPAFVNGYPLIFVDTASYLLHPTPWNGPWDKAAAYGPLLQLLHWGGTLWFPLTAQALLLSALLWLTQRVATGVVTPWRHLALCLALSLLTTAPWFNATIMPDIFASSVVLCLFLLGFGEHRLSRTELVVVAVVGAVAVAVHLSHLPTACAIAALVVLLRGRLMPALRAAAPIAAAMLFLVGANLVTFGRATPSPHGAIFVLARMQEDGPAMATLRAHCPRSGWTLCDAVGTLPMTSNDFVWLPGSPLRIGLDGQMRHPMAMAPEAQSIVLATIREQPFAVARDMMENTLVQLVTTQLGDTLDQTQLPETARLAITDRFPAAELARFDAGMQARGTLESFGAHFASVQGATAVLALGLIPILLWRVVRRGDRSRTAILLCVLVGILANAFVTGALSGPFDRYAARIVWLLPLACLLTLIPIRENRA